MDERAERFARLQQALLPAWEADRLGSGRPHLTIALPSYSVDASVYEHYGTRVPALENRYLHCVLLARAPGVHVVFLSSVPVHPEVREAYLELIPEGQRQEVRRRVHLISPDDQSPRALAAKLLGREDLLERVRQLAAAHGPAMIEAWNVTEAERDLALALDVPIFGTAPELRFLATKSNGRRLFRGAGVPLPDGVEDVHDANSLLAAVHALRASGAGSSGFVAKLDDSVAGDGNVVLPAGVEDSAIEGLLPAWWLAELTHGGIVEERIAGTDFRSPSCQASVTPAGEVEVLSTHEQRLGGPEGQVYEGCVFPADPGYAPLLAEHTASIGVSLAKAGALGRFAVDFVACRQGDTWQVHALEINLRKGGTTHPYGIARLLAGGSYDPVGGVMRDPTGQPVCYASTDNLVDTAWISRTPSQVRERLDGAGLLFDLDTNIGVVPHLLDCLPIDGRMGYTAVGRTPDDVADLERRVLAALA